MSKGTQPEGPPPWGRFFAGGALLAMETCRRKVLRPKRGLPTTTTATCTWRAGSWGCGLTSSGWSSSPTGSLSSPPVTTPRDEWFSDVPFEQQSSVYEAQWRVAFQVQVTPRPLWAGPGRGRFFLHAQPAGRSLCQGYLLRYLSRTQGLCKTQFEKHCPDGGFDRQPHPSAPLPAPK